MVTQFFLCWLSFFVRDVWTICPVQHAWKKHLVRSTTTIWTPTTMTTCSTRSRSESMRSCTDLFSHKGVSFEAGKRVHAHSSLHVGMFPAVALSVPDPFSTVVATALLFELFSVAALASSIENCAVAKCSYFGSVTNVHWGGLAQNDRCDGALHLTAQARTRNLQTQQSLRRMAEHTRLFI